MTKSSATVSRARRRALFVPAGVPAGVIVGAERLAPRTTVRR
ncbi:MAG: hypothetical protein M0014_08255 [Actinomycetota bacterium]|nr:hypothetical protein [Actinomycetota bacterium]